MSNDSNYVNAVADVLASDRRRAFLAFLALELSIAGREIYPQAGEMDQDARIARFASLNEAGHVLGEMRPYAFEWGERVLIFGGDGRLGQVTPPA